MGKSEVKREGEKKKINESEEENKSLILTPNLKGEHKCNVI